MILWIAFDSRACEFKNSGFYVKADTTGKEADSLVCLRQKIVRFVNSDSVYFNNSGMVIVKGEPLEIAFSDKHGHG